MPDHRDILASCLAEIEAGTSSIEECAARYPQMTGLADQLRMALALRELPPITMPEVRKMALERRLLQVMESRAPVRRNPFALLRPLATLAAILLVLSLATFGVARASRSSLPGDFLYGYKRGVEQVELSFAGAQRPIVLTAIAETRLHELELVVIRDQRVDTAFLDEVTTSVNEAMHATSDPIQQTALYTRALDTYQFAASQGVGQIALATAALVTPMPTASIVSRPTATTTPSAIPVTATFTPTLEPTFSLTPTSTSTAEQPTATLTQTEAPAEQPTTAVPTFTPTTTPSETSSGSGLITATAFPTFTPSNTPSPTLPTDTPTITDEPTETPIIPTVMYPTVTPTLTYTFTPIGGNITIVPPTAVPPTSAAVNPTSTPPPLPTDAPTLTPTETPFVLQPCASLTPTPTAQIVDGATITPSPTDAAAGEISKSAQESTLVPCLTLTPTPTDAPTEQTPTQ